MKAVAYYDKTGNILKPWRDAGYECWSIDIAHKASNKTVDGIRQIYWDLSTPWLPPFERNEIAAFFAFPPCTHVSCSGARWFKGKGLRALAWSINLFATAAEFADWSEAPYLLENPMTTMSTYWRKPDYKFHPWQYTEHCREDNYTKDTWLWTGNGFVMPKPCPDLTLGDPDNRIHAAPPGDKRADIRSVTPMGFAKAVFLANRTREAA